MLTETHLHEALEDERHHGWGYAGRSYLSAARRDLLDRLVLDAANDLGLTREELFQWTDSKYGRHLTDEASGRSANLRPLVARYLNADAILSLRKEGVHS
jgi:hypothetical protein